MSKLQKLPAYYECILCPYKCSKLYEIDKHLATAKHKKLAELNPNVAVTNKKIVGVDPNVTSPPITIIKETRVYTCSKCDKEYKANNSLWYHAKKCEGKLPEITNTNSENTLTPFDNFQIDLFSDDNNNNKHNYTKEMVMQLIKQNQEFKELLIEQIAQTKIAVEQHNKNVIEQQKIALEQNNKNVIEHQKIALEQNNKNAIEQQKISLEQTEHIKITIEQTNKIIEQNQQLVLKSAEPTTVNNNTNNNTFNINMFLNEKCKDAITIADFVKTIDVKMHELENIGHNGYVTGMTDILLSRLKLLDITKRPLHCTDLKREVMYFHEQDKWNKDNANNDILRQLLKTVTNHNLRRVSTWAELNPNGNNLEHRLYDFRINMLQNIWGDVGEIHNKLNNKIIKNVAQLVYVDKTAS
jgi:hypothetical protein